MEGVLITGGTGLVGGYLSELLSESGYEVFHLSRYPRDGARFRSFRWDPSSGTIDDRLPGNTRHIIHLAGAGIGDGRWTAGRKREIIVSRTEGARLLLNAVGQQQLKIDTFITASATGYYGTVTGGHTFTEDDPPGSDFTAMVCRLWEEEALKFGKPGTRVAMIRTGVVLDATQGALPRMMKPMITGIAVPVGSGDQYIPWIHPRDLAGIFLHTLKNSTIRGAVNAVAPNPVTNRELMKQLASRRRALFINVGVPSFMLRLVFGEMASIVLYGSRVSPQKIIGEGFSFSYPGIGETLDDLLKEKKTKRKKI